MAKVRIYTASGSGDVYLLREWLKERQIPSEIRGEHLMGLGGAIPIPDAQPTLWVDEAHADAAKVAIMSWKEPRLVHPPRICPSCGEENPPNFDLCWSCEAVLTED